MPPHARQNFSDVLEQNPIIADLEDIASHDQDPLSSEVASVHSNLERKRLKPNVQTNQNTNYGKITVKQEWQEESIHNQDMMDSCNKCIEAEAVIQQQNAVIVKLKNENAELVKLRRENLELRTTLSAIKGIIIQTETKN